MLQHIEYNLKSNTREKIRTELVCLFLQEKSGCDFECGKSVYKYVVECIGPYSVYLQRPAPLNKGFDFVVNVETMYFKIDDGRRHRNPSHQDILRILSNYQKHFPKEYNEIKKIIHNIFQCENFDIVESSKNLPPFRNYDDENIPIAVILCCIKWLFIEQDITYWNWSGRYMLFQHLQKNDLV